MNYICVYADSDGNTRAMRTGSNGQPLLPEGASLIILIEHGDEQDEPTIYVRGIEGMDELALDNYAEEDTTG